MLQPFPNVIQGVEDHPVLGEGAHEIPVAHPVQSPAVGQRQLAAHAPGVLKPHLVLLAVPVHIPEPGGLGGLVKADGGIVLWARAIACWLEMDRATVSG